MPNYHKKKLPVLVSFTLMQKKDTTREIKSKLMPLLNKHLNRQKSLNTTDFGNAVYDCVIYFTVITIHPHFHTILQSHFVLDHIPLPPRHLWMPHLPHRSSWLHSGCLA